MYTNASIINPVNRSAQTEHHPSGNGDISQPLQPSHLLQKLSERAYAVPRTQAKPKPNACATQEDDLIEIAKSEAELFMSTEKQHYAAVQEGNKRIPYPVGDAKGEFAEWLCYRYFQDWDRAPKPPAVKGALQTIKMHCKEGQKRAVELRVGQVDDKIYIDLGTPEMEVVEVDRQGWRIISDPPIYFWRSGYTQPLPRPQPGGSLDPLWDLLPINSPEHQKLITGWLINALWPTGPYPVLFLRGQPGAGKTVTSKILRSLCDPQSASVVNVPREQRDVKSAAANARVLAYDNLGKLSDPLSDAFCALATGAGFGGRKLYTNDSQHVVNYSRPIILAGIEDIVKNNDLLDRCIVCYADKSMKKHTAEEDLWREFKQCAPQIFGALLDALSASLNRDEVVLPENTPRMADFAKKITAAESSLGWREGEFLEVYNEHHHQAMRECIEDDPLAQMIMECVPFEGTATALHEQCRRIADNDPGRQQALPKLPNDLSGKLRKLEPALQFKGIKIDRRTKGRANEKRSVIVLASDNN